MKSKTVLSLAASLALALTLSACVSFVTNAKRVSQAATGLVFTTYVGYTNALPQLSISPADSNAVKQARLEFAATVSTFDAALAVYETNAAVKPQVQAVLDTLTATSSNFVWLASYMIHKGKTNP